MMVKFPPVDEPEGCEEKLPGTVQFMLEAGLG